MSLRRFQNCNTLIINHFRNCGVEDESSRTNAGCLPSLESRPFTLLIPELASIAIAHLYSFKGIANPPSC